MQLDFQEEEMAIGPGGCFPQESYDVPAPAPSDPWDFGDLPVFDGLDWEDQQYTPYDPTGAASNAGGAGGSAAGASAWAGGGGGSAAGANASTGGSGGSAAGANSSSFLDWLWG